MSYERWISSLPFVKILSAVEFRFFSNMEIVYWSEVSHYTSEYLALSSLDFFSFFVVECLHGDNCYKDKNN